MSTPGAHHLVVTQGEPFRESIRWTRKTSPASRAVPVPLAGGYARSQIVVDRQAVLTFDSDEAVERDGEIILLDDGTIELRADEATVSAARPGSGDWSLEVQPPGEGRRVLLAGRATIVGEITR